MHRGATVAVVVVAVLAVLSGGVAGDAGSAEPVDCEFPITVTDATGTEVTVSEEPQDIVVLGPSAAQTMWAIGTEEKVVGMPVNQYTAYLDGAEERTNVVGERGIPIQEKVLDENPDLVLAPNIIREDTVESLRESGLTVYHFRDATSMEDLAAKTERTGQLVGAFDAAASEAATMRGTTEAVRDAVAGKDRPRVYYAMGGGWSTGNGTFIHDAIRTAGGKNIVAQAGISGYNEVNTEVVVNRDPEVLIVPTGRPVPSGPAFNGTTAVQEGNIVRVNANFLSQPAPRTKHVLVNLTQGLHPEIGTIDATTVETPEPRSCLSDVETATATGTEPTTVTATPATQTTPNGADTDTPTTTGTTSATGPGFGPVVAMVALLSFALFGRR